MAIQCKGKELGGVLTLDEVKSRLGKTKIWRAHYRGHPTLHAAKLRFELWTSATIAPEALAHLEAEQAMRTKIPIAWKDGDAVPDVTRRGKEKAVGDALCEHFLNHPLGEVGRALAAENPERLKPPKPEVSVDKYVMPALPKPLGKVGLFSIRADLKVAE